VVLLGRGNSDKLRGETIEGGVSPPSGLPFLLDLDPESPSRQIVNPEGRVWGMDGKKGRMTNLSPFFYVGSEAPVHFQPTRKRQTRKQGKGDTY